MMLIFTQSILAAGAVAALAVRPRSGWVAIGIAALAAVDVGLGAAVSPALGALLPLITFLAAALTLAALVERSGLIDRVAGMLASAAGGSVLRLYVFACGLCALLTAIVSLDGAVVLMVPLVLALSARWRVPLAPLFLGVVVVANAVSIAVPQGNPTNLVVIERVGLSSGSFLSHMLVPGIVAAAVCAGGIAWRERQALSSGYAAPERTRDPLSADERHAALSLAAAALAGWASPFLGVAPWWPFAAVVALALAARRKRPRLVVPWRVAAQVGGLLVIARALPLHAPAESELGLLGLVAVAVGVGCAAAVANNLPVSVSAATLLAAGPVAYATSVGLAVGALATPQGSVATLIAEDLAAPCAPAIPIRRLAPLAAAATVAAVVLLWALR
jgi:arsenical pump membrane protein